MLWHDRSQTRDVYVVRPQDTLYSIAWRYGLDFHDLARWNNIGPDFRIMVGQTLVLTPTDAPKTAVAAAQQRRAQAVRPRRAATRAPRPSASGLTWDWPTERSGSAAAGAGRRNTHRRPLGPGHARGLVGTGRLHRQRHSRVWQFDHHQAWRKSGFPPMRTIVNHWCTRARKSPRDR